MTDEKEIVTKVTEQKQRMHSIVLKERDVDGQFIYIEADTVQPVFPYGENKPLIMAGLDDKAFFIPVEHVLWFEQNFGVKNDISTAQSMIELKHKKKVNDVSFS